MKDVGQLHSLENGVPKRPVTSEFLALKGKDQDFAGSISFKGYFESNLMPACHHGVR